MAQWLTVPAALGENQGLGPSTLVQLLKQPVTLASGDLMPSSEKRLPNTQCLTINPQARQSWCRE